MKKTGKRVASFVIICALIFGGLKAFRYLVTDDTRSYTRIMMHQLYESESNIDILFVGSSHVYRQLIPEKADEIFGAYTFSAGTSDQRMDGSYAIIKEALENHDVSQIYLELFYRMAFEVEYEDRTDLTFTYIISDYIRNPINRAAYLLNASSKDYYINSFVIARRNWGGLLKFDEMSNLVAQKNTDAYRNYEYEYTDTDVEYYVDRGFVANNTVMDAEKIWYAAGYGSLNTDNISSDYIDSLTDIVELCQKEGVELTFFIAPMPETTIMGKGNYDDYSEYMKNLADSWGIEFYDFNLCRETYFDTGDNSIFKDEDHLNTAGAEKFTELFSSFFTSTDGYEDLFYSSFSEKISGKEAKMYGLAGPGTWDEVDHVYIITNRTEGLEYRITLTPDGGEAYVLQDFSENRYFEYPAEETGTLTIECRTTGSEEVFQVIETTY